MPDKTSKPSRKRTLKNAESFRERALKASNEKADKSKGKSGRRNYIKRLLRPIVKPLKKVFKNKIVQKILRPIKFIGRFILPKYFRDSFKELKQVTWPSLNESRRLTTAVIIFAVIFGATVALVDYGLGQLFKNILLK
jgi:preprotein translocase SecE subunit